MRLLGFAAGAMAVAAFAAAPREAQAGTRFGVEIVVGHGYGHGSEAYRVGYDRGYRDGFERGARDADHHRGFDFDHDKRYRCADAGYHGHYGPKSVYQSGYRRGYELAYREAYGRRFGDRDGHHGRRYDDHRDHDWDDR